MSSALSPPKSCRCRTAAVGGGCTSNAVPGRNRWRAASAAPSRKTAWRGRRRPGDRLSGNGGSYNAPRVLFLDEGPCRLYCSDRAEGIVSAVSDDGDFTFRLESGRRIVRELSYEAQSAFAPEVLLIDGGGFRMYYAGYSKSTRAYILTAVSDDGLRWHKEPEPVIAPGGRYDRAKCSELGVMRLPEVPGKAPGYCIFYEACDGTAADERGVWRILSATSAVSVGPGTTEGRRNLSR